MLARLSSKTSKALGLQVHARASGISISDDEVIAVDVDCLREFLAPLPAHVWQHMLGSVTPMYKTVHSILTEDTARVVDVLLQLELEGERQSARLAELRLTLPHADDRVASTSQNGSCTAALQRSQRRRRRPLSAPTEFSHRPNTDDKNNLIPTIIVTPCPPQSRSAASASRTPYQDSDHRNRLVVPGYFVANDIYPPQLPHSNPHLPLSPPSSWKYAHLGASTMSLKDWAWEDGHWKAVLPSLEEQSERGLFARSLIVQKKPSQRSLTARRWRSQSAMPSSRGV